MCKKQGVLRSEHFSLVEYLLDHIQNRITRKCPSVVGSCFRNESTVKNRGI